MEKQSRYEHVTRKSGIPIGEVVALSLEVATVQQSIDLLIGAGVVDSITIHLKDGTIDTYRHFER